MLYFKFSRLHDIDKLTCTKCVSKQFKCATFWERKVDASRIGGAIYKKVQVGKDQEKAQSERDSHSKNRGGKKPN